MPILCFQEESGSDGPHSEHTARGRRFTKIEIKAENSAHYRVWETATTPSERINTVLAHFLDFSVQLRKESQPSCHEGEGAAEKNISVYSSRELLKRSC